MTDDAIITIDHRPHWQLLVPDGKLAEFVAAQVARLIQPGNAVGLIHGSRCHAVEPGERLRVSVLLDRRPSGLAVISAYPYSESPYLWPLELRAIERTADGSEGRLTGTVIGAPVTVFDTLFFKNRERYTVGEVVEVQVSAIAYVLEPEPPAQGFAPDFAGYAPIAPISKDSGAPPDEVEVHSVIEVAEDLEIHGVELTRYALVLARLPEFTMAVDVYARRDPRIVVGQRVRALLWLFGFAPDPALLAAARRPSD